MDCVESYYMETVLTRICHKLDGEDVHIIKCSENPSHN